MSQQRANGSGFATGGPDFPDLPEATVARLPEYLRALHQLAETGHDTVSSEGLAAAAGVNSAKLRKDLSHLGSYGTRGVGYDVRLLIEQIEQVLGLHESRAVALVGIGNLGHALAGYAGFATRGLPHRRALRRRSGPGGRAHRRAGGARHRRGRGRRRAPSASRSA